MSMPIVRGRLASLLCLQEHSMAVDVSHTTPHALVPSTVSSPESGLRQGGTASFGEGSPTL